MHKHLFVENLRVLDWIINTQLGRRNLTPIQKIAIAEKYRPIYEKRAKENQGKRNDLDIKPISAESSNPISTRDALSKIAGVGHDNYNIRLIYPIKTLLF